jgi:signal transduction histidine kinase/ligand-binding sensor domain-containing protein
LKKLSPKQKAYRSSNPLWHHIILVSFMVFISCKHQPAANIQNETAETPQPINGVKKNTFAAPKIIPITSTNAPKIVKAGKPVITTDSSNGGNPFFNNYGTDQGLALSSVHCSIVDAAGNLWFGTLGGGASRYDGRSFTNFTPQNGLAGGGIYSLMEDANGNIWFGTHGEGVSKYDGNRFISYTTKQGLAGNFVRSIMQDKSGNIWFGTGGGGLSKYDGKTFTNYTTADGLAGNEVYAIMEAKSGDIWFGTNGGGASRYDGKTFINYTIAKGLAGDVVSAILQVRSGDIWFGTNRNGASRYDGKRFTNFTVQQGLPVNSILGMFQDSIGNIWFGTLEGGVSRYDGITFSNYTKAQGLAENSIANIQQDKTGDIWFCSLGGGVSRYIGSSIKNYTSAQGNGIRGIYSIIQSKTGKMWIGSRGGGITSFDGKRFMNYTTDQGLINNDVRTLMEDTSGNIWVGTFGGVSRYDGKSFTNFTKAQGLLGNDIWSIMQDRAGIIWFGSDRGGVSRYDGKSFKNYDTSQGLGGNDVWRILEDKKGNIWLGTHNGGISKFDGISFTNYSTAQGLASNNIYSMILDKSGTIWVGTDGAGASRFDGQRFINFSTSNGLADNVVCSLAEDTLSNIIWMGTNLGYSGLKLDSGSGGNTFEIFNKKTGYPIKDLNVNDICVDKNGILWGGTGDGYLVKFDYKAVKKTSAKLNLVIQNIQINNEDISWYNLLSQKNPGKHADSLALMNEMGVTFGKALSSAFLDSMQNKYGNIQFDSIARFYPVPVNLVLPYDDNNLTVEFAAIEPDLPQQVKYQYKLEGYNKDWSPQSNSTSAVFGNLPEGSYIFRLMALSPYGTWSETNYKFRILPPWQRTWWAYSFYGICLLAGIYFTDRIRRKVVIENERAKTRERELAQAKEIEKAYTELKVTQAQLIQSEKMASLGELTAGIAHEIQNPLNFVNNFSEVNKELLQEMKTELMQGNNQDAVSIADNVIANEEKINRHGQRADAIVKGMLQHSRSDTGVKEPTDINALADEYLRLSYNGLRARDKSFNATLNTNFDRNIGLINIIPQDIGRMLLNLFNNAFYAVSEKKKNTPAGYEPTVSLSTKKANNKVEIRVRDNGNGIPVRIKDKIFQPFFTTKPAGQGTGLGLSLNYDIIKAHGGEISVDSQEGEFTEFVVIIPTG